MFVEETVVETPVNKEYDGFHQDLPLGSYVTVPDNPALKLSGSFSFTAWIASGASSSSTGPTATSRSSISGTMRSGVAPSVSFCTPRS